MRTPPPFQILDFPLLSNGLFCHSPLLSPLPLSLFIPRFHLCFSSPLSCLNFLPCLSFTIPLFLLSYGRLPVPHSLKRVSYFLQSVQSTWHQQRYHAIVACVTVHEGLMEGMGAEPRTSKMLYQHGRGPRRPRCNDYQCYGERMHTPRPNAPSAA